MMTKYVTGLFLVFLLVGCSEPEQDFVDSHGKGYGYLDLRSEWLVINYWATWCAPCIKEIPELNRLASEFEDVKVFGVNFDGVKGAELQKQITKMGINFPVFAEDPAVKLGLKRPDVLPTTYILGPGKETRIVMLVGPQTMELIRAEIE